MAPTTATGATTTAAKPAPAGNNAAGARAENPAGRGAYLTDDEILGLVSDAMSRDREVSRETDEDAARSARQRKNANGANAASSENGTNRGNGETDANAARGASSEGLAEDPGAVNAADGSVPENLRAAMEENPELRQAWQEAQDYREIFATPQAAREATAMLGDLNRLDELFFSRRPEDHAELARTVAQLDPAAFASLSRAMAAVVEQNGGNGAASGVAATHSAPQNASANSLPDADATIPRETAAKPAANEAAQALNATTAPAGLTPAQSEFFQAANASAVEGVLEAIESQLDRLLPENMPARARTRVAGEVYRELDAALRGNRQFTEQMRRAFQSGALDAGHQRAIVSLVTRQARQALPGVAKRVLNEWTSALVTANAERRERQRSAERRVDIAGTGGGGRESRRSASPRDIDYSRMSDADILNL
ncbi:MAG: hypothetical protein ACRD41_04985 [Candidatus Acidiferrales bacterium]